MLQLAPPAWDAFALEAWCPLICGGTTAIHSEPVPTAASINESVERWGVNTLFLTTALFNVLVEECLEVFASISVVMCGGERVSPPHILKFRSAYPTTTLLHVYGPVECSIFATAHLVGDVGGDVPIGTPVANTSLMLQRTDDWDGSEDVGEIILSGDGLARCYIGNADETDRRFAIGAPGNENERVYRTGDLARLDETGDIFFAGRTDSQLKIHGMRIEPGELESFAEMMPEIARAVVLGVPLDRQNKVGTVIFYTLRSFHHLPEPELRKRMAAHFPGPFVPMAAVQVESVPLGESGKKSKRFFESVLQRLGSLPSAALGRAESSVLERELARLLDERATDDVDSP